MPKVCVVLADGFEEIEAITIIDVLRRAEIDVITLGVDDRDVTGAHGIPVFADRILDEASGDDWDMVILPGGLPGAHTLRDHSGVQALIRKQHERSRPLAAICAAPIALGKAGVLRGRKATSYPGFETELTGADYQDDRVVIDGDIITSRGPGTALEFSLALAAHLKDRATADRLRAGMLVDAS